MKLTGLVATGAVAVVGVAAATFNATCSNFSTGILGLTGGLIDSNLNITNLNNTYILSTTTEN